MSTRPSTWRNRRSRLNPGYFRLVQSKGSVSCSFQSSNTTGQSNAVAHEECVPRLRLLGHRLCIFGEHRRCRDGSRPTSKSWIRPGSPEHSVSEAGGYSERRPPNCCVDGARKAGLSDCVPADGGSWEMPDLIRVSPATSNAPRSTRVIGSRRAWQGRPLNYFKLGKFELGAAPDAGRPARGHGLAAAVSETHALGPVDSSDRRTATASTCAKEWMKRPEQGSRTLMPTMPTSMAVGEGAARRLRRG